jgi:hypothetical protein
MQTDATKDFHRIFVARGYVADCIWMFRKVPTIPLIIWKAAWRSENCAKDVCFIYCYSSDTKHSPLRRIFAEQARRMFGLQAKSLLKQARHKLQFKRSTLARNMPITIRTAVLEVKYAGKRRLCKEQINTRLYCDTCV